MALLLIKPGLRIYECIYECVSLLFYIAGLNLKSDFTSGVNSVSEVVLHVVPQQLMVARLSLTFGRIRLQFLF